MVEKDESLDAAPGAGYRSLPREEPPPALDAAILAAARLSVDGPVRSRWARPVAIAAVLVLSVGVTLRVAEEKPDAQMQPVTPPPSASVPAPPPAEPIEKPAPPVASSSPEKSPARQQKAQAVPAEKREAASRLAESRAETASSATERVDSAPQGSERVAAPPAAPTAAAAPPNAFGPSPRADSAQPVAPESPASAGAPGAPSVLAEKPAMRSAARLAVPAEAPEAWLKRIVELRAQGRQQEADESLAEFRRRHPGYVIPPDLLPKIEPPR